MPRSLAGQMALVLALALLMAQTVSFSLLYQSRERLRDARDESALARVINLLERDLVAERISRRLADRRMRPSRFRYVTETPLADKYTARKKSTQSFRQTLQSTIVRPETALVAHVSPEETIGLRAEMQDEGQFAPRIGPDGSPPEGTSILLSVQLENGEWLNILQPLPPDPPLRLFGLAFQTVFIYAILLGASLLVTRQLSRPLARLKEETQRVLIDDSGSIPKPEGPEDVKELTKAFYEMRERVEALFKEKDIMLGAIGHDLRTPLTSLRLRVEQVDNDKLRTAMTATIEEMAEQLKDILSLARTGEVDTSREVVAIEAFVQDLLETVPQHRDRIVLGAIASDDMEITLSSLRRALRNLLENAVRYGERAHLTVAVDGPTLSFIVEDEGPGMPVGEMEDLRAPFVRGEASRNRGTGGAGLGLAIVDRVAAQLGGELILENGEERGLKATLSIPHHMPR